MVRTPYHKPPGPRAKQPYPTVTYWRANEGLVFVGTLLTAPDTRRTAFFLLFSHSVAWPFRLWQGL